MNNIKSSQVCNTLVEVEHDGETWLVSPMYVAPIGIGDAVDLAASLGCELPTPGLVDAIWRAADMRVNGWDIASAVKHDGTSATMDSSAAYEAAFAAITKAVGDTSYRLIAGCFKDVVLVDGVPGLYGWHNAKGKPIQTPYTRHALGWRDYSQGLRLVRRKG